MSLAAPSDLSVISRAGERRMSSLQKGRYLCREAQTSDEIAVLQALRARCFQSNCPLDQDDFDARCRHFGVYELAPGGDVSLPCAAFRLLILPPEAGLSQSYGAQFYGLEALSAVAGPKLELGRFCITPDRMDPDILRLCWAMLTRIVDEEGITMLIGCSSFRGVDPAPYHDVFALLHARHQAPSQLGPSVQAAEVWHYPAALADHRLDLKQAQRLMPPLLRSYLMMGAWVSDHAVIDRNLGTLHVYTAVSIADVPHVRARLLRMAAQ